MNTKQIFLFMMFIVLMVGCTDNKIESGEIPQKQNDLEPKEITSVDEILDELFTTAKKGMITNSSFNVIETTIEEVESQWGKPDKVDKAGYGYYAIYDKRHVAIGYNEVGEIFDLRSYSANLMQMTSKDLMGSYDKYTDVRKVNDEQIYVYSITDQIELKVIISDKTKKIHHVSVFNSIRADHQDEKEYILDIKGTSNQLSDQTWQNMLEWRWDIIEFSKKHENVYINGRNEKMVALTFDDGPDAKITPQILDILNQHGVKGNFFFVGEHVKKHSGVVKNAYESGHLILSHSYHHVELTKLGVDEVRNEINMAGKSIKAVIGKEPAMIRTPFGDTNDKVAKAAHNESYSIVLWSIDTLDWSQKEAEHIAKNVLENVRNGDIILMHSDSDKDETVKALPLIIEGLKEKGYDIVNLEKLLRVKAYQ